MANQGVVHLKDLRHWGYEHDHFEIKKIENSTRFQINQCLSKEEVNLLIYEGWKVVIKE